MDGTGSASRYMIRKKDGLGLGSRTREREGRETSSSQYIGMWYRVSVVQVWIGICLGIESVRVKRLCIDYWRETEERLAVVVLVMSEWLS